MLGANSLPPDQLKQLGWFIGTEAAAHYKLAPGSEWTEDYVAALVHNGCQMYPDAYYLGMIGRAIRAVAARTEPAAAPPPAKTTPASNSLVPMAGGRRAGHQPSRYGARPSGPAPSLPSAATDRFPTL